MKAPGVVAGNPGRSHQVVGGRIHFQAFTHWLVTGFPMREATRIRITSRGARALLIDMG